MTRRDSETPSWPLRHGARVEIATYDSRQKLIWKPAKVIGAHSDYAVFEMENGQRPAYGRKDEGTAWRRPPVHSDTCEAEADHPLDCGTASELGRLRAFAEQMHAEFPCTLESVTADDHVDDCVHCAALAALERAR